MVEPPIPSVYRPGVGLLAAEPVVYRFVPIKTQLPNCSAERFEFGVFWSLVGQRSQVPVVWIVSCAV